jgi:hypothetical protein
MRARRSAVLLLLVALGGVPATADAAGTWGTESYLASPLREATGPSLAVTTTGGAVAGWQAQQGQFADVDAFLATRASGTAPLPTGGTQQHVASAKAHAEGDMGVVTAIAPSGKAVVAWVQATYTGNFLVQATVRAAGATTFGAVQTLTAEGQDAGVPAVAMNASGATVLVWRRHEDASESWQVQGAMLTDAGTTFTPLNAGGNISDEPLDGSDFFAPPVHVAIAPSGAAVVTWDSTSSTAVSTARWAQRDPGASFGTVHDLGAVTLAPDVAAGDSGFALTWATGSGGTGATVSLARATTGSFGAATPVATTPGSFIDTHVALDGAGNAIVALLGTGADVVGSKQRVAVTTCAATCDPAPWLSADGQSANGLGLAVNAAGDAVAAWSRSNGTHELIEASLRAHGSGWDPPVFVSRSDQDAHAPTVGIDGGGNVTAAWTAANVALFAVRQATGAVAGATVPPPADPGTGDGGTVPISAPATTTPAATTPTPAPVPAPAADRTVAATVKQGTAPKASAAGAFSGPKVTCAEAAGGRCTVKVTVTAAASKTKKLTAARATLTVAGGQTATPKLKLSKAAKALLRKQHRLALTVTVAVTDGAGNTRTFTVKTTLKAAAKKRHR